MSLFNVGISGLLASQRALTTTGHNISNVNTPGYSRQRLELAPREAQPIGVGYLGKGVVVEDIRRVYDNYLTTQVRLGTSNVGQDKVLYELASQVDKLLADPYTGLAPAVQDFFDAMQGVADDPSSLASRQVLLTDAETLVQRFHSLENRLADLGQGQNQRLRDTVAEVNSLAQAIADLNQDIRLATGSGGGSKPNDLLDQRDELLRQLGEKVGIDVLEQGDGSVNVFVGTGQALVVGVQSNPLALMADAYDPTRLTVGYGTGGAMSDISGLINGGELAGLLKFRDQVLDPTLNALGRVAVALSATVNEQHRVGMDLGGTLGGDFFADIDVTSPAVRPSSTNTGAPTPVITAAVTSVQDLTSSDYRLERNGGGYSLTRLTDGNVTALPAAFGTGTPVVVDGVTLTLTAGTIAVGDSFTVEPTRAAARDMVLQIRDVQAVAAAAPVRSAASLGNIGSATIAAGTVSSPPDPNLLQPVTITFTAPNSFDVVGVGTGNPAGVAYTPGADINYNGWTVQISGTPSPGDQFTITANAGGVGDNRNALLLAELQTTGTLNNGQASYEDAYGQMVADVGTATRQAEINFNAQEVLLEQSQAARDTVAGVNLDEEAANLLRFQQSYQASARIIAAADALFQSLLDAVGS
ncbi:MAG: flagellar hook-associated protein FlgK [Gammaproteobacteria bacterium]|nr:flagellar hook-associated protein FlgK [Gammaproteobacteria bacterium]